MNAIEQHAAHFRTALLELHDLEHDETTAPAELAGRLANAREALQIAARRLSAARAAQVEVDAGKAEAEARALYTAAAAKRADAELQQRTALGTLTGCFGEDALTAIVNRGIVLRSLKALTLDAEADSIVSRADELSTSAAASRTAAHVAPVRLGERVTVARIRELTSLQLAGDLDNLTSAALTGRIVEG